MPELLLEALSEEIPAAMQEGAAQALARLVSARLAGQRLAFTHAHAYATPRRLALVVDGLPEAQPDVTVERKGPRIDAPERAIAGFCRSAGVAREALERRETEKGVFLFAVQHQEGRPTAEVLSEILPDALGALPWPKSMRWGTHELRWVRPLHAILCLFDGRCVPLAFGHLKAGGRTVGHRFLAPVPFAVGGFASYAEALRERFVVLDAQERRRIIAEKALAKAQALGLELKHDEALIAENAGMVEWPVVLAGAIDEAFMAVPEEVLIAAMRSHQRYLCLLRPDGRLAPRFLMVANIEGRDGGAAIVAGNERVLRARLADAKFFWDQDRKRALESRVHDLAHMVFHARLGTMLEKAERIAGLAATLAPHVPGADPERAKRAGLLAKADLTTGMVGEFPELQGVMGRYYALNDGEEAEIAQAIAEHYAPEGPADRCPTAPLSVAVALADKVDTLAVFFVIGERPTGSKDPFALRRAALGVIRLVLENALRLSLLRVFRGAIDQMKDEATARRLLSAHQKESGVEIEKAGLRSRAQEAPGELLAFFAERLKVYLRGQGLRHDLIAAVFEGGRDDDLVRILARVRALGDFLGSEDGADLLIAYRRAANIVRIEESHDQKPYAPEALDAALFQAAEEKALFARLEEVEAEVGRALEGEDFVAAMAALARLRKPVDAFFDRVTVNCDDPVLRANRLRLLARLRAAMDRIADFSKIEGGEPGGAGS